MTTINNNYNNQSTMPQTSCFESRFDSNEVSLNLNNNFKENSLDEIYMISPYIYDLFMENKITQNTAELKCKNLFNSFSKLHQKDILNQLLQLKIHNNFNLNKLELFNPVY